MDSKFCQNNDIKSALATLPSIKILGVQIHSIALNSLLELLSQIIICQQKITMAYINIHTINIACENLRFRSYLNTANISFCDGFGVKLGAKLLGLNIEQRYSLPDWIPLLSKLCVQHKFSIFLLGGRPGVAEKTAIQLWARFPDLQIVGFHDGYFDKTPGCAENEIVVQKINTVKPNILLIGFGMPLQEFWLEENWQQIQSNIALPVGAALDYLSGEIPRGPLWMTNYGFEWLTRLVIEPRRLWKRYIVGNPLFLWRVLKQRFKLLVF